MLHWSLSSTDDCEEDLDGSPGPVSSEYSCWDGEDAPSLPYTVLVNSSVSHFWLEG